MWRVQELHWVGLKSEFLLVPYVALLRDCSQPLLSLCMEASLCSSVQIPKKNLLWRSQECHTEEVKLLPSPKKEDSFPSGCSVSELRLEPRFLDFLAPYPLGAVQHRAYRGIFPLKTNRWRLLPFRLPLLTRAWYFKEPQKTCFLHKSSCHIFICGIFMVLFSKTKSTAWLWELFGDLQALWHTIETCRFTLCNYLSKTLLICQLNCDFHIGVSELGCHP